MTTDETPLLLVSVGTDHHPFDRLVRWAGAWLAAHPGAVRCLMQTGTSAPPGPSGPAAAFFWSSGCDQVRRGGSPPGSHPRMKLPPTPSPIFVT